MQNKIKTTFITLLALFGIVVLIGICDNKSLGQVAEFTLSEKIDIEVIKLKPSEAKYVAEYEVANVKYQKHEYSTPTGATGTQVLIKTDDYVESIGYGPESKSRTFKTFRSDTLPIIIATTTKK